MKSNKNGPDPKKDDKPRVKHDNLEIWTTKKQYNLRKTRQTIVGTEQQEQEEEPPQKKFPILTPAMERASVSHALAQLRLARTHGTHERIEIEIDFPVNRGNTA